MPCKLRGIFYGTDMTPGIIFLCLVGLCIIGFVIWRVFQKRQIEALRKTAITNDQRAILLRYWPLYKKLPLYLKPRLEGIMTHFLNDVRFVGAKEFQITEKVRILIAAQAALLIVNKSNRWYDTLQTVIVYPAAFKSKIKEHGGALVTEREVGRSGESWKDGPVVLSWEDSAHGALNPNDGRNVVYHEFAHQLDQQTGAVDGAPLLDRGHNAAKWGKVMQVEFDQLKDDLSAGRETLIDPYGATAPAEFFAVITEIFFEKPEQLKSRHPTIYQQFKTYYKLDPVRWMG